MNVTVAPSFVMGSIMTPPADCTPGRARTFLEILAIELRAVVFVMRVRRFKEQRREVIGIESLVGVDEIREAGDEQSCAGGEHEARRHLPHDQR